MHLRWLIAVLILVLMILYTVFKMLQLLPGSRAAAWGLTLLLFGVMLTWQFAYRGAYFPLDSRLFLVLAWAGSLSMGLWTVFMLLALPIDLGALVLSIYKRFVSTGLAEPERRAFFTQWLPSILGGVSGGMGIFGFQEAIAGPRLKEVSVPVAGLPAGLEGLRIAQISDLHVGPTIRKSYVRNVVRQVMELDPDLIAVTGDLIDGFVEALDPHTQPLSELKAPLGVYYVTGNHEYYWGAESWIRKTAALGFTPLINEHRVLSRGGANLLVAGVTDTSAHQFLPSHRSDPGRARAAGEKADFRLLLAHRPDSCFEAEKHGFDLQLSGHTHAGQFFPWSLLIPLVHRYYKGLNRHGRMWVYVNAGTGYWGPALRLGVPAEITLLRLVRS